MHHTTKDFWKLYYQLPKEIQDIADKNFELLKKDRRHSSLQFKKIEELYSVRVGLSHRALGIEKNRKTDCNGFRGIGCFSSRRSAKIPFLQKCPCAKKEFLHSSADSPRIPLQSAEKFIDSG